MAELDEETKHLAARPAGGTGEEDGF